MRRAPGMTEAEQRNKKGGGQNQREIWTYEWEAGEVDRDKERRADTEQRRG